MFKKHFFSIIISFYLLFLLCFPLTVKADSTTIEGTNVTVRLAYKTLYIEGNGAIPDYTPASYATRPWQYLDFDKISISSGITQIGSYAFADCSKVKEVTIPSTTFIKDSTSFAGLTIDTIFRIKGTATTNMLCGTIPYTSLDSIAANAPNGIQCTFILDSPAAAVSFQQKAYPYMKYVYSADDKKTPWEEREDTTDDINFRTLCRVSPDNNMGILTNMTAQIRPQGSTYNEVISSLLGDYTYLYSYNMALTNHNTILYGTDGMKKYVLYLSPKDQIAARMYRLIEIGPDGQIYYLDDLDTNHATVTFSTAYPTSTYALVYKYDIDMLLKEAGGIG